jgi:hypothetical protein
MSDYRRDRDLGRINRRPYKSSGLDRQQRLTITLGVTAAIILALGVSIGFAVGRATAPQPEPQPAARPVVQESTMTAGVVEEVATETLDPELYPEEVSEETTDTDETPPPKPKQKSPKDGAVIDATRVTLRWSEVEDDSGEPVTYAFEIQDRLSSGSYGKRQVIGKLKETSYSARVLYVKRRWRVWAVDEAGNKSDKTGWRYYQRKAKPAPKPAPKPEPEPEPEPEPSDETT